MFIKDLKVYIQHRKLISAILKEENLLSNLSKLFDSNFKQDWIGRIYTVLNPIAQSEQNERIISYDLQGANMKDFVNKWIMERMIAADQFVKNHGLFDILVYEVKQLDEYNNFLMTLTPIAWYDFWSSTKRVLYILTALIILGIAALIIF